MKNQMPIQAMLEAYAGKNMDRWHMPGHKGNIESMPGSWDVTEVEGSDNLHHPSEGIAEAQKLLAEAAGACHSHLLVGGSTAGIHAMLALLAPGDGVIISRWVHKAATNALQLYGLKPHWVQPGWDEQEAIAVDEPKRVLHAIEEYPDARAVFVTSPDYFGRCLALDEISSAAHRHGMLLFVDCAHGAHFPFSELLPASPAGLADAWVTSAHKTLPSLTQSAWLHAGSAVEETRLLRALAWVQSSSPSYWLMASLDRARVMAQQADWAALIDCCHRFRDVIHQTPGLKMLNNDDPTRLVVDVSGRGISGMKAEQLLREAGIEMEMADARRVVAIATPWDESEKFDRLASAMAELPWETETVAIPALPEPGEAVLPMSCARGARRSIPLCEAAGHTAADAAGAYPPGIALWQPGERIEKRHIDYLTALKAQDCELFGVYHDHVEVADEVSIGDL